MTVKKLEIELKWNILIPVLGQQSQPAIATKLHLGLLSIFPFLLGSMYP